MLITFLDENDFRKKQKALARYFRKSYKYLIFEVLPTLTKENKKDGLYSLELPSDELFQKVYGKIILKFSVKNDVAILEDIEPREILLSCYSRNLLTYKGVPFDTKKDFKKLKIMEGLINGYERNRSRKLPRTTRRKQTSKSNS